MLLIYLLLTILLIRISINYTVHNEKKEKEVNIMFTKMAIRHLRKRIVKIDDENERLKAKAFLNLIEQFLKKKK